MYVLDRQIHKLMAEAALLSQKSYFSAIKLHFNFKLVS